MSNEDTFVVKLTVVDFMKMKKFIDSLPDKDPEESSKPFDQVDDFVYNFLAMETFDADFSAFMQVLDKLKKYKDLRTIHRVKAGGGTSISVGRSEPRGNVFGMNYDYAPNMIPPQPKQESTEGKDWEIVAYRNPNVVTDVKGGEIVKAPNSYAVLRNYPIHSVKRKSDGEVFSVGEKCRYKDGSGYIGIIAGFKIINNSMIVDFGLPFDIPIEYIKNYRKSQLQQESKRIEVTVTNEFKSLLHHHNLYATIPIPDEKYPQIKSAIEKILNNE